MGESSSLFIYVLYYLYVHLNDVYACIMGVCFNVYNYLFSCMCEWVIAWLCKDNDELCVVMQVCVCVCVCVYECVYKSMYVPGCILECGCKHVCVCICGMRVWAHV